MHQAKPLKIFAFFKIGLALSILLILVTFHTARAQTVSKEYQVKSVFLFNFSRFVDWPASSFNAPQSSFVIGILGDDPFNKYLDETVEGERVMEHPVTIQRYKTPEEIGDCQILFISYKDASQLQKTLPLLTNRAILTVSDDKNFTSQGGMISFATVNNKIRLYINVNAAKNAGLNISSKLLRLAEIQK